MTATFIAQVVENYYNKLDLEKMAEPFKKIEKYNSYGGVTDEWINTRIEDPTYIRWCQATNLLETYCRQNFTTFQETDLVRKWAKGVCERRNHAKNRFKAYGWYSESFSNFLHKNRFY